jgi:serine/threonine-protein kinase
MAPEEFTLGATIDQRTTIFTLGRAAAVLLGDGTPTPAAWRGGADLAAIIARACQTAPEARYGSVAEFYAAWRAARSG